MVVWFLVLWVLFGHVAIWVAVYNRLHSWGIPRAMVLAGSVVAIFLVVAGPLTFVWGLYTGLWGWLDEQLSTWPQISSTLFGAGWFPVAALYALACVAKATSVIYWWVKGKLSPPPAVLRHHVSWRYQLPREHLLDHQASWGNRLLLRLPGNESLDVELVDLAVDIPHLPAGLDRLRIVQLSDLHLSGRVPRAFFERVVEIVNDQDPDFVLLTGDVVEKPECLSWVPEILGELRAEYGRYFVLGNHDVLLDVNKLRRSLEDAGLIDLGNRVVEVPVSVTWGKRASRVYPRLFDKESSDACLPAWQTLPRVVLVGSERPWIGEALSLSELDGRRDGALLLAISHTPDQIVWARKEGIHLLLAGHLHGGQIRIPVIGPIVSPSRFGTRLNAGLYFWPPTLLYVSRGLSARFPLRWQAPPEVTCLTLRAPQGASHPRVDFPGKAPALGASGFGEHLDR
ncbi:MAG: metallophosphoesterase [Thermoguttaceae bacterium]|nr:metallophosphoesterase [Thermoguttaceae bacterium]MDW8077814.1 metallophosphoesterase [Thermoguttaceae bacterium]